MSILFQSVVLIFALINLSTSLFVSSSESQPEKARKEVRQCDTVIYNKKYIFGIHPSFCHKTSETFWIS